MFAKEGYDIEMLPEKKGGNGYGVTEKSNPDYLINGKAFDCFSPEGDKARNTWTSVKNKTQSQAERIVLNLVNYKGNIEELYLQFQNYNISTLKELLVIMNGKIIRWLP